MEFVPLLHIQRDLLNIPRGMTRFHTYLDTVLTSAKDEVELVPMLAMNPMSHDHVAEALDHLLGIEVEDAAANAVREFQTRCPLIVSTHKVGLVILDDVAGGGTNRPLMIAEAIMNPLPKHDRGWVPIGLWASESYSRDKVYQTTLHGLYAHFYKVVHGAPVDLQEAMRHIGMAAKFAGIHPTLDDEELTYSQTILKVYATQSDFPTVTACLLGDEAAASVGFPPVGLSQNAGMEVAIMEAWASAEPAQSLQNQLMND